MGFIHVKAPYLANLATGIRLMNNRVDENETYNLCNGKGFSVLQAIKVARKVTNQDITYQELPRRASDPARLIGDASLAKSELHWTPQYKDLGDIIETAWQLMLKVN